MYTGTLQGTLGGAAIGGAAGFIGQFGTSLSAGIMMGAFVGGAENLAWQTVVQGKSLKCVDLKEVGGSALLGGVTGGVGKWVGRFASRGFESFSAFKKAMGLAGPGQAWHHIVEQTPSNITKFGSKAIHNTKNLMKLPHGAGSIHAKISGYYSSIQPFTSGQTVRKWLSTQSYKSQLKFGKDILKAYGWEL